MYFIGMGLKEGQDDLSTEAMYGLSGGMMSVLRQWVVSVVE